MRLPRVRFTVRKMMIAVAVAGCMIWVTPALWSLARLDFIDDAYALWGAGDMVVDYMKDHEGRWPGGWDDLRPYFQAGGGRVGGWTFEAYRRRVRIDWSADVAELERQAKASPPATFRVIWGASLLSSEMSGHEPNRIVAAYLRGRR